MAYDKAVLEQFVMQAEKTEPIDADALGGMDIAEIGKPLGLSPAESKEYACYLRDAGWARLDFMGKGAGRLWLTPAGHEAIALLKLTPRRRWFVRHKDIILASLISAVLAGTISGLLVGLVLSLAGR